MLPLTDQLLPVPQTPGPPCMQNLGLKPEKRKTLKEDFIENDDTCTLNIQNKFETKILI
jgi:hypothetical protein